MKFGSNTRASSLVVLVALLLVESAAAQQSAVMSDVKRAVNRLRQLRQWQHLDADWVDSVFSQTANGPELNVEVTVTSQDGKPVVGALVAVQESHLELLSRFTQQLWPGPTPNPIRALAVTDAAGVCRFDAVRTTPPGNRAGRIASHVVVADLKHGFDWRPLIKMSRQQAVTVTMAKQTPYQTQVRYLQKAAVGIHVSLYDCSKIAMGSSDYGEFELDHHFGPRVLSDEQGIALFSHLPQGVSCRLSAHSDDHGLQFWSQDRWTIDAKPAEIVLQRSRQKPFRAVFVDAETNEPIGNVRVEGWYASQQAVFSDREGRVSTRAYFREGKRSRITAAPPDSWVREVFLIRTNYLSQELAVPLTHSTIASGRVIDAVTGSGIAGVTLNAVKENLQLGAVTSSHNSIAETDREGNFAIALSPGEQEIAILSPVVGYQAPIMRDPMQVAEFLRHKVVVKAGETIENLRFSLMPAKPISGRVVDDSGKGVAGAEVFCHLAEAYGSFRDGLPLNATVTSATTDDEGRFSIALPAGETRQLKLKARFDKRESPGVDVEIDPAKGASGVELKLGGPAQTYEIFGRVMRDDQPWAGVAVKVESCDLSPNFRGGMISRPWNVPPLGEAETDADGRYRIEIHVSDVQHVCVSVSHLRGSPIVPLDRPTVDLGTIEYFQHRGEESVCGTVVDPLGLPVSGVSVQAQVRNRNYIGDERPKKDPRRSVTDQEGRFTIGDIFLEPVEITVRAAGQGTSYQPSTSVTIEGGTQDAQIVFDRSLGNAPARIDPVAVTDLKGSAVPPDAQKPDQDPPAHSIEGFVVDDNNKPIAGATVRVFCAQPINGFPRRNPIAHPACSIKTTTDEEGTFAIGPIDAKLKVRLAAGADKHYATIGDFVSPTADVEAAIIELANFKENSNSKIIKQILKDATGKPLPHAVVSLARIWDQDIHRFQFRDWPSVMTDANGQLELVSQGNYFAGQVSVFPVGAPPRILHNRRTPWASSRDARVQEYPAVEGGFSITGRIVDQGQPVSGYVVCLRAGHAMPGTIRVATDQDGRFRIDNVGKQIQYTLFGDIRQPKSTHLVSRRLVGDESDKLVDFGDLPLEKMHELAVKVVPAPGQKVPPTMTVTCKLMSGGPSISANVSPLGDAVLERVPGERVQIWIGGRVAIEQTIPPMQRLHNPGQYGMSISGDQVLIVQLK